jgi:hypothetical protein
LLYHSLRDLGFSGVPKPVEAELKSEAAQGNTVDAIPVRGQSEVKVYHGSSLLEHHRAALR